VNDDRSALHELLAVSEPGSLHVVLHYLYFPAKKAAEESVSELRSLGFRTESRVGADGVNWLVLARKEIFPSEETIATGRQQMEDVARRRDGEYDGWEAEV
jgi:hypothetical protein